MRKTVIAGTACAVAGTGVLLGAFGAHALKTHLSAEWLSIWQTAVLYQLFTGLALLALAGFVNEDSITAFRWPVRLLLAGVILFSGSLYLLALTGWREVGIITPFGGLAMLAGWAMLVRHFFRS